MGGTTCEGYRLAPGDYARIWLGLKHHWRQPRNVANDVEDSNGHATIAPYNEIKLHEGTIGMAKKSKPAAAPVLSPIAAPGERVAGYFRKVFKENPAWLKERSNDKLLQQWLTDHPGTKEVPPPVKKGMAKIKGVLRSKKRRKVARVAEASQPAATAVAPRAKVVRIPTGGRKLETLELHIDECLIAARHLDREGLHDIIAMLRRARNAVVWQIGQ